MPKSFTDEETRFLRDLYQSGVTKIGADASAREVAVGLARRGLLRVVRPEHPGSDYQYVVLSGEGLQRTALI